MFPALYPSIPSISQGLKTLPLSRGTNPESLHEAREKKTLRLDLLLARDGNCGCGGMRWIGVDLGGGGSGGTAAVEGRQWIRLDLRGNDVGGTTMGRRDLEGCGGGRMTTGWRGARRHNQQVGEDAPG
jgi:hypothetical protein